MNNYISVLLPIAINQVFFYEYDNSYNLQCGQFIKVPFHNEEMFGIVWEKQPSFINNNFNIKKIICLHDIAPLSSTMMDFIKWVADYNMASLGAVFKMILSNQRFIRTADKILAKQNKPKTIIETSIAPIELSELQNKIVQEILSKNFNTHNVFLLEGVTGSGKTEVYLKVAEHTIKSGGQVLILIPEIILTTQLFSRFQQSLPNCRLSQWHSSMSVKNRHTIWQSTLLGEVDIIVGARSSLFLPFKNLKLVIVDEEHDAGFKQEEGVIYNARDMAIVRAKLESIPIILSSATPSIETIVNAQNNKYIYKHLPSRFSGVMMPDIKIIDMSKESLNKHQWLSHLLRVQLKETLEAKKQSLLFLNRRGYSPIILCNACGCKNKCINCNSWLVWHRSKNILQCHYCGYHRLYSNTCQKCGSKDNIAAYGPGVERIAEEVSLFLPKAKVAVLTSDTISNYKDAAQFIKSITKHEVDIIIGTQLIAKGLHFGKLHLVGVIEADCNYVGNDIRGLEKAYQLLHQVAGRAGRETDRGIVLLQSFEPNNLVLQHLASGNQDEFIAAEIADRKAANMPPFSRLALISAISKQEQPLIKFMHHIASSAPNNNQVITLGPTPCPITILRGKHRYRFIIKANKQIKIQNIIQQWLSQFSIPSCIRLKVDIDPYNFM